MNNIISNKDGLVASPYLIPENIKKDVIILGVKGTCEGGRKYTGETSVTPSFKEQTIPTKNTFLESDITVKAISPIVSGMRIESGDTDLGGKEKRKTFISAVDDVIYLRGQVKTAGWYNANTISDIEDVVTISDSEASKIIPENIKAGVTILGVEGSLEQSTAWHNTATGDNLVSGLCELIKELSFGGAGIKLTGTQAEYMFYNFANLTTLDLNGIDFAEVTSMAEMFTGCTSLANVTWSDNWGSNASLKTFDVTACPLTHDSCLDLFNKLATSTKIKYLYLNAATKALMSADEISIAEAKKWVVD